VSPASGLSLPLYNLAHQTFRQADKISRQADKISRQAVDTSGFMVFFMGLGE
jgi:hypothetical protein